MTTTRRILATCIAALAALVALPAASASAATTPTDPAAIHVAWDVTYSTAEGEAQKLDVYWPKTWAPERPAIVIVHGGAWAGGDKSQMEWMGRQMAAHGYVTVAINYRLKSATPWPAEITDVQNAIRFVRSRAATSGIDPNRIAVMGDSAGGNLASLAGAAKTGSWSADARVKAVVSFSGIHDLNAFIPQVMDDPQRGWLPTAVERYTGCPALSLVPSCVGARWVASGVNHLDASDPPQLLIDSTNELIPMAQATLMEAKMRTAGVPVERMTFVGTQHGLNLFDDGLALTVDFLRRNL